MPIASGGSLADRASGARLAAVVVVSAMGDTTDEFLALAGAITDDPDSRELDVLLATGEHQSATLVSMALHALGVPAISLTGAQAGITTDGRYGRARIANIDPRRVKARAGSRQGGDRRRIPGHERGGLRRPRRDDARRTGPAAETTTLGRGGSDTTAVALAARLNADRCQIFTDVRGIYTADPRLLPDARQLHVIGYEEMLEMAQHGAQVMQTRAVELGWVNDVVIEVLSSFEDAPGTLIKEDLFVEQRNKVRGLAHDRNVAKVTLVEVPDRPGVAHAIFAPLADAGISVDIIVQNVSHGGTTDMSFTVPRFDLAKARRILEPIVARAERSRDHHRPSVAKVSIVGAGIQNAPGYAARMFGALADAGVNIEAIATSDIRITCLIGEDGVEPALRSLHEAFELELPDHVEAGGGPLARATPAARRDRSAPFRLATGALPASSARRTTSSPAGSPTGTPEVCLAIADEQTAGRGRAGRTLAGAPRLRLLISVGFRPTWLPPDRVWQLAAVVSLAMARPARSSPRCPGTVRLKWPNDLVVESATASASLQASSERRPGSGTSDSRAVIGIGVNADWSRADFPTDLADTMTSLRELARATVRSAARLRDAFLVRLEAAGQRSPRRRIRGDDWQAAS